MISIQAHRATIGAFLNNRNGRKEKEVLSVYHQQKFAAQGFDGNSVTQYFLRTFGLAFIILILSCNYSLAFLKFFKLLSDGDVESNPGADYIIVKVVQGNFYQGHPQFGVTAGIQCACNSLFSICWSVIRRAALWSSTDLDYILIKGDSTYKSLRANNYLSFEELSRNASTDAGELTIHFLNSEHGELTEL